MQMFRLFSDCHIGVPRTYTNMASHTELCEFLRSLEKCTVLKLWELSHLVSTSWFSIYIFSASQWKRSIVIFAKWDSYMYLYMPSLRSSQKWRDHFVSSKWCVRLNETALRTHMIDNSPPPTSWLRWFDIICTGPYPAFSIGVLPIFPSSDWCENYTSFCKESKFGQMWFSR